MQIETTAEWLLNIRSAAYVSASIGSKPQARLLDRLVVPWVAYPTRGSSRLPLLEPPGVTAATGVRTGRLLKTVNCQRDVARPDMAAFTAKLYKVRDKNDKLCSFLAAFCDAFQASCLLFVELMSQSNLASCHLQSMPTMRRRNRVYVSFLLCRFFGLCM